MRVMARLRSGKQGRTSLAMGISLVFSTFAHRQQRFLTVMGTEGQQMRSLVLGGGCCAHRFAVQGHGFLVAGRASGIDPGSQYQLDMTDTQAGQEATRERASGRGEVAWPKEPTRASAAGRDNIVPPLPASCSYRARPPPDR